MSALVFCRASKSAVAVVVLLSDLLWCAVPKKHKSRTKTKIHRAVWKSQARAEALKALSLAKSVLSGRSKSFVYVQNEKKEEGETGAEGETSSE